MTELPQVRPAIRELTPWAVELRRTLHRQPELAYHEVKTAALARRVLTESGLVVKTGFGQTGLAAVWDSGRPGLTVAVRGEMDALNISEPEGCPFSSEHPGLMHACGHDFNLALVLSLAKLAASGGLAEVGGRLMFICQPAEEGQAGARAMLDDGLLEVWGRPDFIFASHAEPLIPVGRAVVNQGVMMAGTVYFEHKILGRGGHAATPEAALNPLPAAAGLITAITDFKKPAGGLITVTMAQGSVRANTIAPEASLAGTLRYHSQAAIEAIVDFVEQQAAALEKGGFKVLKQWRHGYPPVVNHSRAVELIEEVGRSFLGRDQIAAQVPPSFCGEDFAFFLEKIPGAFFFIGTGGPGENSPLHSPLFSLNEKAIPLGLELWARLVERVMRA